jgi:hypothetical protein
MAYTWKRLPCPFRVLCESAELLADIAAADHLIHAQLLTPLRCPARFNLQLTFFPGVSIGRCMR